MITPIDVNPRWITSPPSEDKPARNNIANIEWMTFVANEVFYVIIPGSGSITAKFDNNDWFRTNFIITGYTTEIGRFHRGYSIAASEIRQAVWRSFEISKCRAIHIVGHSLGAAVGGKLALDTAIKYRKQPLTKVFYSGFSCPGWAGFFTNNLFKKLINSANIWYYGWDIVRYIFSIFGFFPLGNKSHFKAPKRKFSFDNFGNDHQIYNFYDLYGN